MIRHSECDHDYPERDGKCIGCGAHTAPVVPKLEHRPLGDASPSAMQKKLRDYEAHTVCEHYKFRHSYCADCDNSEQKRMHKRIAELEAENKLLRDALAEIENEHHMTKVRLDGGPLNGQFVKVSGYHYTHIQLDPIEAKAIGEPLSMCEPAKFTEHHYHYEGRQNSFWKYLIFDFQKTIRHE